MSSRESSPAFLFYVKDWRSSRRVSAMSYAERGMYLEMLVEQWDAGSVPGTPKACAALFGGPVADWRAAWSKLRPCFERRCGSVVLSCGRLANAKLESVRQERHQYQKSQRESGLRGAAARWNKHGKPIGSPSEPIGVVMAKNGSSSSSSTDLHLQDVQEPVQEQRPALARVSVDDSTPTSIHQDNALTAHVETRRATVGQTHVHENGTGLRERFDQFWAVYPKKIAKEAAWKVWQKRRPSRELTQQICAALAWQRTQDGWLKDGGKYIPNPATWIAAGRWQDEPTVIPHLSDKTLALRKAGEEFLRS